jgi:hypothetical protein
MIAIRCSMEQEFLHDMVATSRVPVSAVAAALEDPRSPTDENRFASVETAACVRRVHACAHAWRIDVVARRISAACLMTSMN